MTIPNIFSRLDAAYNYGSAFSAFLGNRICQETTERVTTQNAKNGGSTGVGIGGGRPLDEIREVVENGRFQLVLSDRILLRRGRVWICDEQAHHKPNHPPCARPPNSRACKQPVPLPSSRWANWLQMIHVAATCAPFT